LLLLDLLLLLNALSPLLLLLQLWSGIEHLPAEQHSDRQNDREKKIFLAVLVLKHESLG
jgi:hypothetical protein